MLQHDPTTSPPTPDAAHTRVKVDILAKAVAAIEARRQEQARLLEGTAMVGDVVKDLQLDISPEELLAEAEAQQKAALSFLEQSQHWKRATHTRSHKAAPSESAKHSGQWSE